VAIARRFGFDESLITPTTVSAAGLKAARAPKLTLRADKLIRAMGEAPPGLFTGLQRFYELYQQGYPQKLREMLP
jgi:hypothetical protein